MKSAGKAAVMMLLPALLAGCRHRPQVRPPAAAQAPALPLSTVADNVPLYLPPAPLPDISMAEQPPPEVKPKPHKEIYHRRPRHVTIPATPEEPAKAPQPTPQQAADGVPTDISPIGQLSAAGESTNLERRRKLVDEINSTEKSLNDIKRPLNKEEQTTATQIRTFLAKAKDALTRADLDGANTLVTKAKVLLKEIARG
ncbi:MAG: hypothetical protein WBD10_04130 [Acidobacteriaceae bacterium]